MLVNKWKVKKLEISEGIEQGISSWNRGLSKVFFEVTFVRRYFQAKLKQIVVSCNIILKWFNFVDEL